jgi:hypothetical protein
VKKRSAFMYDSRITVSGIIPNLLAADFNAASSPRLETTTERPVGDGPVREQPRRRIHEVGPDDGGVRVASPRVPFDQSETVRLVARRRRARRAVQRIDDAIEFEVGRARSAGMSWDEVGRMLGITRQGARQRYGVRVVHSGHEATQISTDLAAARRFAAEWATSLSSPTREAGA